MAWVSLLEYAPTQERGGQPWWGLKQVSTPIQIEELVVIQQTREEPRARNPEAAKAMEVSDPHLNPSVVRGVLKALRALNGVSTTSEHAKTRQRRESWSAYI